MHGASSFYLQQSNACEETQLVPTRIIRSFEVYRARRENRPNALVLGVLGSWPFSSAPSSPGLAKPELWNPQRLPLPPPRVAIRVPNRAHAFATHAIRFEAHARTSTRVYTSESMECTHVLRTSSTRTRASFQPPLRKNIYACVWPPLFTGEVELLRIDGSRNCSTDLEKSPWGTMSEGTGHGLVQMNRYIRGGELYLSNVTLMIN